MSTNLFSVGSPSENPGDLGSNLGRLVLYPSKASREKNLDPEAEKMDPNRIRIQDTPFNCNAPHLQLLACTWCRQRLATL